MLETELPIESTDQDDAATQQPTARDTQRNALRDLLSLSLECSTSEAELETRHRQGILQSREQFEKLAKDFEYRLDTLKKQINEKADAKQRQIELHFQQEHKKAEENFSARRQKAQADYDKAKADLKKRFDHATWLADSVLEAAEVQAQQEYRKDTDRQNDQNEASAKAEADAAALVQTYGQRPEPIAEGTMKLDAIGDDAFDVLEKKRAEAEGLMQSLRKLGIARLVVGIWPVVLMLLACAIAAGVVQYQAQSVQPQWDKLMIPVGATFGGMIVLLVLLKVIIGGRVKKLYAPLRLAIADVRTASQAVNRNADRLRKTIIAEATKKRNAEVEAAKQRFAPVQKKSVELRDKALGGADADRNAAVTAADAQLAKNNADLAAWRQRQLDDAATRLREEQSKLKGRFDSDSLSLQSGYAERRDALQKRWHEGLVNIQAPMGQEQANAVTKTNWTEFEKTWISPKAFPPSVSFGSLSIDLERISAGIPRDGSFQMALPDQFKVPAVLAFPRQASIIIETDPEGREDGLRILQMVMMKLLTQLPSGRARFVIMDPVGLGQSFAGFMHLADHDEQLVTNRIWTTPEQIDQRLIDMTEHMETVIQKYLRNEYETIDEYNAQAGELAEPYRFLVFADFPSGIEGESWRRLMSIARSGARCGVYTLILRDTRQSLPGDVMIEDLEATSATIVREDGKFVWRDEVYRQFPLTLDSPPDEETLTKIVHKVGRAAKEAARVEVSFETIAPKPEEFWTMSAAAELAVPVGRMGATRLQYFRCGRGMAQHSLVAGKTGSGKSTLLHALVTNLAMWYSPDEVEFYLIDFKKGVEFKTYADFQLPHARAIAVESDREFGLSVLQRIDAELARRGEMFRREGVQDLATYRKNTGGKVLPRVMLIIDEFQEFFTEDDKVGQDAQLLLDRLVRQGRAFGIHVFLGSQTIGGSGGLARSTISQMGIRIALQCSEADSQLILGDNNGAARLLSRPGEAIYNDAGGAVENNSPFQVAFLTDERKENYLAGVNAKLKKDGTKRQVIPPLVFEGNMPADLTKNAQLAAAMAEPKATNSPTVWIGDPVAIKEPTSVTFRRQSGSNMLIIGQVDEQAMATIAATAISLSAQLPKDRLSFVLFDGTPADSMLAGTLPHIMESLPNETKVVDYRATDEAIAELTAEYERRQADAEGNFPSIFVLFNGLQRYRTLRKGEDEGFSFNMSDEPKKASASKQLVDLIREGPNYGMHFVTWFDTLASSERTFERAIMREFDNRLLFQMSANDSSNLIDSPTANKLGFFRALAYSEEQGVMEKFRPYGLPPKEWLAEISETLKGR